MRKFKRFELFKTFTFFLNSVLWVFLKDKKREKLENKKMIRKFELAIPK